MHAHFLDPYRAGSSLVHALDARVKFVLALAFILTTALAPPGAWAAYILLLAVVLSVELLSELGVAFVLRRSMLALPFVLAALPVLFTIDGPVLFQARLGAWTLTATSAGLARLAAIGLKSWISVQAAILLATTTSFPDLLMAMRAVRVPRLLVAIFGLMWRYLFVLADEVMRLSRARQARSGQSDRPGLRSGGSLAWRARITGGMAGNLFLRAFERSDRIYTAMLSRGYDGEVRAAPLPPLAPLSWGVLWSGLLLLGGVLALSILLV
ncbi:MAG: cobalt ECF transporter T component CbiQ [Chloroflexota bacterium]